MQKMRFGILMGLLCAAALVLQGCGGGGDGGVKRDLEAQVEALTGQLETANGKVTELTGQLDIANGKVTELTGDRDTSQAEVRKLTGQLGAVSDDVTRLAGQLETAKGKVTELTNRIGNTDDPDSLWGMLDAAKSDVKRLAGELKTAKGKVTELTKDRDTAQDEATRLTGALTAATKARDDALKAETDAKLALARAQGQLEGLDQRLTQAEQDVTEAERRGREAEADARQKIAEAEQQANVSLRAGPLLMALDLTVDDDETVEVEYMPGKSLKFGPTGSYTRGSAAPSISGWRSASFSRLRGNDGTETAYLYTNIGSPSHKHFWKVYGEDVDESDTNFLTKAKPSGFGMQARKLFPDDSEGDPDNKDNASRGGTYDGYSGTFSCANGCNIEAADGGALTFTGDWTFKARATAGGTPMQDTEYLYFGIWAFEPKTPSDPHEFKWIADGGEAIDDTYFTALTGTATFNGGAVGKYVLRNQVGQKDRIGTFTAKATFTANFGADPATLDGRITDFREGGSSLAGWSVYLGSSSSQAATLGDAGATGTRQAHASIGGVSATGDWAASLHGSNNPGYTDFGDDANQIECPVSAGCPSADLAGVAGWFDAFSEDTVADSDAAIAGVFAAAP